MRDQAAPAEYGHRSRDRPQLSGRAARRTRLDGHTTHARPRLAVNSTTDMGSVPLDESWNASSGRPYVAVSPATTRRMAAQRREDTAPERQLRRHLYQLGLRYRLHQAPIAGLRRTADIVFPRSRTAIFVDGCFWHGCQLHRTIPTSNHQWWSQKIDKNRERDRDTDRKLVEAGWFPIRVWEHDDPYRAALLIRDHIRCRLTPGKPS